MKKLIVLLIALLIVAGTGFYVLVGPTGAFLTYSSFMTKCFKMKFDAAEPMILKTAKGSFANTVRFYKTNFGQFREGFFYPKYEIISQKVSPDGSKVDFVIHQTVRADSPGEISTFGTIFLAYKHKATLLRQGLTWRIRNFSFSPTKLAKEPIKKKVITRRQDAKKSGFFENFLKPVQELFQSLSGSNTDRVKKAVKSNLESALKGEKRTFQLNSGSTISGFVIQEDEVYYTVRESSGAETIVFKEDLKS